jgi:predicted PurR-regulated permease PerM
MTATEGKSQFVYKPLKRSSVLREDSRLFGVVVGVVVITTLYFARVVFIPLALALLFSLVLTPPVAFLEKIRMPRILSIFLVVVILMGLLGFLGWKTSQEAVDLTNQLPEYSATLQNKIRLLKGPGSASLNKASDTVRQLSQEIGDMAPGSSPAANDSRGRPAAPGSSPSRPMAVEVVPPTNPLESVENLLGPVATGGVIIIFTVFILVSREDLRNRLIRLAGGGRLNMMTRALDEATQRINRYLFLQLLVNTAYGLVVFAALYFLRIPNASLWGVAAGILRFLPYVGPPMAGLMPIILALAVFPGWQHALATVGFYVVLEIVVSNFIEPTLYGAHIGLSPLAILVAAVFWTLIWGFPGLVLSTPITVCLVVMGRYVPSLSFFNVLLGDEPVLSLPAQYYQRLLATDQNDARQVLEQFLKEKPLEELYSTVLIPALSLAEHDRHRNELDEEHQTFIYQSTREMIEELAETPVEEDPENSAKVSPEDSTNEADDVDVLCVPARDDADEVIAMLLSQLLGRQGRRAQSIPIGPVEEMLSQVAKLNPGIVCISALPPFAMGHARELYAKLRTQFPSLHIVICLWHFEGDPAKTAMRLKVAKGHAFFTTLPEVLEHVGARTHATPPLVEQI